MPYDEFFEQVRSTPLLVLDDLGVQSGTAWAKEKLDQLLTSRFNNELPTVVVTATPLEQMEDRLRTRLTDQRLCRCIHPRGSRAVSSLFVGAGVRAFKKYDLYQL